MGAHDPTLSQMTHEPNDQDVVSRRNGPRLNHDEPVPAAQSRHAAPGTTGEIERLLRAASIALHQFPGPAGQLLHREILSHLQLAIPQPGDVVETADDHRYLSRCNMRGRRSSGPGCSS